MNDCFENGSTPYVVVAVSEGLRHADGSYIGESAMSGAVDSFGHKYLAGTGKYLENLVRDKIGCKVRSVEINILQRCASHAASKTDIDESLLVGERAAELVLDGQSGIMAAFVRGKDANGNYTVSVQGVDVRETANAVKKVPAEFINETGNGVNARCIDYLLPLIRGEVEPAYRDGLPIHFSF